MAASGDRKGALEDRLEDVSIRGYVSGHGGAIAIPTRTSGKLQDAKWVSKTWTSLFQPQHLKRVFPITAWKGGGVNRVQREAVIQERFPITQDSSSTMKLVAEVFCISPMVLHPYPPK